MKPRKNWAQVTFLVIVALFFSVVIVARQARPEPIAAGPLRSPTPTLSPNEPWQPGRSVLTFPAPRSLRSQPLSPEDRERIIREYMAEEWKYRVRLDEQSQAPLSTSQVNGPIAFVGTDGNLWVMDPNGSNQRQLTTSFSDVGDPTWSPSGDRIVFVAEGGNVYMMNADGTGLTQIVSSFVDAYWFAWSPDDGTRILFTGTESGDVRGTYIVNADGTSLTRLAAGLGEHSLGASWSPDGQWIILPAEITDGSWGIYKLEVASQQGSWLPGEFSCSTSGCTCQDYPYTYLAEWSPDGSKVAFDSVRAEEYKCGISTCCRSVHGLYLVDADGSTNPQLIGDLSSSDNPTGAANISAELAWASDAINLAGQAVREDGAWHTYVASASEGVRALNGQTGDGSGGTAWSPDASLLVAALHQSGTDNVYIVDPIADSWGTPVAQGALPDWGQLLDSDHDGLPDEWETNGYNGVDLSAMGADPYHKDIFIEVDWMKKDEDEICSGPFCFLVDSHRPKKDAIKMVVETFRNAPVPNPDGRQGINLHVDFGPDTVMDPETESLWGNLSKANHIPYDEEMTNEEFFCEVRKNNFTPDRRRIFHYVVFAHFTPGGLLTCQSGRSWASDFIVTLGGWGHDWNQIAIDQYICRLSPSHYVGTTLQQAGTFMHELGHNLGLEHGGQDGDNYKPNYLSVMNYWFQTRGLIKDNQDGYLDYSRFSGIPSLNENDLNEQVGLNAGPELDSYGTRWSCLWKLWGERTEYANQPIDWNCHFGIEGQNVTEDVNKDSKKTELQSFDDWDNNITLGRGCIGVPDSSFCFEDEDQAGLCNLVAAASIPEPGPELTLAEDALIFTPFAVSVVAGPSEQLQTRSQAYVFTILNGGTITDTYDLETSSVNGWADLSSVPEEITLNPQQETQLTVEITIPPEAQAGDYDEVLLRATSQGSPAISDMAQVWVRIEATQSIYLPVILKSAVPSAPDLIVEQLTATSNNVEVVIKNIGDAPVTDPFWVDVYINPNPAPTQVNQIWNDLASQGLVWGIDTSIAADGGTLTLTINDAYYYPDLSSFSTLPEGTPVYVQVDSVSFATTYGGVLETHEITGGAYNNITNTLSVLSLTGAGEPAVGSEQPSVSTGNLPPR